MISTTKKHLDLKDLKMLSAVLTKACPNGSSKAIWISVVTMPGFY